MDQIAVAEPYGLQTEEESDNQHGVGINETPTGHTNNNNNTNQQHTTNDEYCFDKINRKWTQTLRLLFININGIPRLASDPVNKLILKAINKSEADIIGIAEHNSNFYQMDQQDSWFERTDEWWEGSKSVVAQNVHDTFPSPFLPGGVLSVALNKACHRCKGVEKDPSGLGRWCTMVFRGSNGITLRVITAYRPCSINNPGPRTAWSQQERYLLDQGDNRNPREAMLEDLVKYLTPFQAAGEQIIVMMDCNEDVRCEFIKSTFARIGLREAITENREGAADATYHRNTTRTPIDGIFMSESLFLQAGGYLPFGYLPSDHRAIYIDILITNAFGFRIRDIPIHPQRRLKCDLPWVVTKFKQDYKHYIKQHSLHIRLYNLQTLAQTRQLTDWEAYTAELNSIMEQRKFFLLKADKHCRKLCMGNVAFSDAYERASAAIGVWNGVITKKKGAKFSTSKIMRLARKARINNPLNCTLEEAIMKKNVAYTHYYKNVKPNADKLRKTFLEHKAELLASSSDKDPAKVLTQLRSREKLRKSNRRINFTLQKLKGAGVTKIQVPNNDGTWRDVTDQKGIEQSCMTEFEAKYRQTEDTICMQPTWAELLGFDGKGPAAESILDGTFQCPAGTHQYICDFFQAMKKEPHIPHPAAQPVMSTNDYILGWKKMKERTSAGITGIHFGHMKACATDPELADFEATVSHIPYSTGVVPEEWKQGVCCMLPKKSNSDKVTDLRTIVLQECEYNFNNKKIGKDAMNHAERNNFIAWEQYGSRKGRRAIDQALNKRLTYDLIRFNRRPASMCSNDAKSCYDRVLHSIMSLAFRRMGFPEPPVDCMISCLQQMKHFIKTSFGVSDNHFTSRHTAIPLQGILQGNGAGPTIWVLVSTPLLHMLRRAQVGAHLLSAISKEPAHFVGFAFVDDTDLITFNAADITITTDEIFDSMQESIDRWEAGLKATGGAIVPNKSWVYPITFEFDSEGMWKYTPVDEIDREFSVLDHAGIRQVLQSHGVDIGMETLGVILAPDGNNRDAISHMRKKATKWAALIQTGHLQPTDVHLATESRIMKSLEYPLLALTLTEKECSHIMAPVLDACLSKSHVCRKYPRALTYGPVEEMGLGFHSLYTLQGVAQLSALIQYLPQTSEITGHLLRSNIEAAKIELGIGGNFFNYDFDSFSLHMTDCWLKSLWCFVSQNKIEVVDDITQDLRLKREHDKLLMVEIIKLDKYKPNNLLRIRNCYLYLQVYCLSDIINGSGTRFTNEAWNCQRNPLRRSPLTWPHQPRPGKKSRRLWKQAIKLAFPRLANNTLIQPLGKWNEEDSRSYCTWFFHPPTHSVYRRFGNDWKKYKRRARRGQFGSSPKLQFECNAFSLPPGSCRATVEQIGPHLRLTGWADDSNSYRSFSSFEERQTWSVTRALQEMHTDELFIQSGDEDVVTQLLSGSLEIISDGSYLKLRQFGTAAWVVKTARHNYVIGRHRVSGNGKDQCSHRSELSGILGAIIKVNLLCTQYNIRRGSATVKLSCDGSGAINVLQTITWRTSPSQKHFDIIHSIRDAILHSPLDWHFEHVKGHQDDMMDTSLLHDTAYLNTVADKHAKDKLHEELQNSDNVRFRSDTLPYRLCSVRYKHRNGSLESIDSEFSKTLYHLIHTDKIRDYWEKHGHFQPFNRDRFDRGISAKAITGLSKTKQKWVSKWCSGICGTGSNLKRWKQQIDARCPRCHYHQEDTIHVLQCGHADANTKWQELAQDLYQWMIDSRGDPNIATVIRSSLHSWRHRQPYPPAPSTSSAELLHAYQDQSQLGWYQLFLGVWSKSWVYAQQAYFIQINSQKSALLWMAKLQRKIWMIAWSMWEHRNDTHHNTHNSYHPHEVVAIGGEVIREWQEGLSHLPQSLRHLFNGNVHTVLAWTTEMKLQWLLSVRKARHHYYPLLGLEPTASEPTASEPTVTAVLKRYVSKGRIPR